VLVWLILLDQFHQTEFFFVSFKKIILVDQELFSHNVDRVESTPRRGRKVV